MDVLLELAKEHAKWVEIARLFGVSDYAEDVVQEMYIKVSKSNISLKNNYKGYIYIILRNIAYDYHKTKKYDYEINDNLTEDTEQADDYIKWLDVQKALHKLPLFERQVLQLHKIEGISLLEIQTNTDICRIKMAKARDKGITKLKKLLEL